MHGFNDDKSKAELSIATSSTDGLMSSTDKQKVDSLLVETIELSVGNSFNLYDTSNDSKILLKRTGSVCEVSGQVKPKSTITGSNTTVEICTIPSGYRPARTIQKIQHGSGNAEWLGAVRGSDGAVNFSRYRDTANASGAFKNCDTNQWLPFHFIWIIGG